jgi:D-arginine dehydrogenase
VSGYDVAIVGGGIAGTSVGYFLAREGLSVVVVEREPTLGVHSTGRSAAIFTECYGTPVVRRLALGSRSFLEDLPDGFSDDPILGPRGILFPASPDQADRLEASAADQRALVASVELLDPSEAIERCPVLDPSALAGAVLEPDAMDLDVHALHMAYQRSVRRLGGELRTGFEVTEIDRVGDHWAVRAPSESVEADVLVDAAGAWCDVVADLAGVSRVGLVPKRRTAFTFAPPVGSDPGRWPMVIDLDEQWYFKPEGPHLLASPCDATPVEPHDVRHREEDVALGIERIAAATTMRIRSIQTAWAGLRSFVADEGPVNGWDDVVEGFYWLAGQGGFGIKSSPAMGRYAAGMIAHGEPPEDLASLGLTDSALGVGRLR